jgi:hypothetical protein
MLRWNFTVPGRRGLSELIRDAVVEAVLNERREVEVRLARVADVALVPIFRLCEPGMYEADARICASVPI